MSYCLLHGHDPQEVKGVGAFKGRSVVLCVRCGMELERREETKPRGYEAAAQEFFEDRSQ